MTWRAPKEKIVGPLEVIAVHGRHWVLDRGNGAKYVGGSYKTRRSAERWAARHQPDADLAPGWRRKANGDIVRVKASPPLRPLADETPETKGRP